MQADKQSVVCIGAGPAGLTAAYQLSGDGYRVTVLEQDPVYVGGISRTVEHKGFAFDIGGHRFFSKSAEVENLWSEILADDFLERPRKSRIYYRGQFFDYPIRAMDALSKLGMIESARCLASYLSIKIFPYKEPRTVEQWVTNHFGRRLFQIFFQTYTEKVWGMKCSEISADWAAQRIKGLSLTKAIWHALVPQKEHGSRDAVIKTLVTSFRYPRRGPGMLWEAAAERIRANGGKVLLGQRVETLQWERGAGEWRVTSKGADGGVTQVTAAHVISSMPLRELVQSLQPAPSSGVLDAARRLRYRDFLVVALVVKDRGLFDDNWIYIHDPGVKVGRVQNFKSWSPEMVPNEDLNCYGMEYFCFEGDGLWTSEDSELIRLASAELVKLGLAAATDIVDGSVVRQPKAYPVYDDAYQHHVATIRAALESDYPNLQPVGRNGMHKYNNQDHAMMTAMLAVKNIQSGRRQFDLWRVNQDAEYHEEGEAGRDEALASPRGDSAVGGRLVPRRL
ncbi:MAG TPA: NAD(P)/FAD-dependent oxidoreductase [Stellaceae bacterium]|nr:NAD(P)/FAD-dependent oxidoreductase [Stellaceae bacterium]